MRLTDAQDSGEVVRFFQSAPGVEAYVRHMKILVTGATGKVGSRLAQRLAQRGDQVRAMVRDPARAADLRKAGIELAAGDLLQADSLAAAVRGVDAVVHCAAFFRGATPEQAHAVNDLGSRHLASAARAASVKRFVFTSTGLVYGPRGGRPAREDDDCAPVDGYPASKLAAERFLLALEGLDVRVLRLPFVYGDGDPHIEEALPMMRTFPPTQRMSIGHHADIAQAVARVLDSPSPKYRIYNVVDDESPELATLFASVGAPRRTARTPNARAPSMQYSTAPASAKTSASSRCSHASLTHSPEAPNRDLASPLRTRCSGRTTASQPPIGMSAPSSGPNGSRAPRAAERRGRQYDPPARDRIYNPRMGHDPSPLAARKTKKPPASRPLCRALEERKSTSLGAFATLAKQTGDMGHSLMDVTSAPRLPMSPSPVAAGVAALRRFWRPFLLIQATALALGLAYRISDPVRAACATLAQWRTAGGLPFTMVAGALAGGVLPEIAKSLVGIHRHQPRADRFGEVSFNIAFFGINGAVVDGLYRLEALLFGDDAQVTTVMAKTAFDQLVFTPLWSSVIAALFLFRRRGFSWESMRPAMNSGFFYARVLPLLLPNFCFWIPIVLVVYALPSALQYLMFAFALAAWSLIMVFIASQDAEDAVSTSAAPSQPQS